MNTYSSRLKKEPMSLAATAPELDTEQGLQSPPHLAGSTGLFPRGTLSHATVTTQTHTCTPGMPVSPWKLELLLTGKPGLCRVAPVPHLLISHPN